MKQNKGRRHTNDTNLIFWRLRILKPVRLSSRLDWHEQLAKANWLCANDGAGNAGYLSQFLKIDANQAQNLHIISFEAAALSAEWLPANQVPMRPLTAESFHGPKAGSKWRSKCLGFGCYKEPSHDKKPAKSHPLTPTDLTGLTCRK